MTYRNPLPASEKDIEIGYINQNMIASDLLIQ